jgi:hypothetical protein
MAEEAATGSLSQQVDSQLAAAAQAAMLPEIDGLPGAEQEATLAEGQTQMGAGQGRADVGRHVVGPFVGMAIGAELAQAADWANPLDRSQGLQVSRQIDTHLGVGIFVDGEAARGVHACQVEQTKLKAAGLKVLGKHGFGATACIP